MRKENLIKRKHSEFWEVCPTIWTLILNVSDEMKLDDVRQELCGLECGEELCSSSLDTTEELYSSSVPDTCGDSSIDVKGEIKKCRNAVNKGD